MTKESLKNLIRIPVFSKVVKYIDGKGKERSFRAFTTKMNILVKGEEDKGKQLKYLTLKFRKTCNVDNIKRGYLIVERDKINAPFIYEVKQNISDEGVDLGKEYPVVWVREYKEYKEVLSYHRQDDFVGLNVENETEETEMNSYAILDDNNGPY